MAGVVCGARVCHGTTVEDRIADGIHHLSGVKDLGRCIKRTAGGVRLNLRIQPRASRTEIAGLHGDAIRVRLSAPPADGAANQALVEFLSTQFAVPRSAVRLLAGEKSRSKVVAILGVDLPQATRLLGL